MIVDCHTHVWQSPEQLGQLELGEVPRLQRKGAVAPRIAPRGTLWRNVPGGS